MKKPYTLINILFVLSAALLVFSCSKTNQSPKVAIIGKWNITADTAQTVGYPPYIIVGINSPYMQFNADGTGTAKNNIGGPDIVLNFTYTISNNIVTSIYPLQSPLVTGFTTTATIQTLTSHKLILRYDINTPTLTNKELVYMSK